MGIMLHTWMRNIWKKNWSLVLSHKYSILFYYNVESLTKKIEDLPLNKTFIQ